MIFEEYFETKLFEQICLQKKRHFKYSKMHENMQKKSKTKSTHAFETQFLKKYKKQRNPTSKSSQTKQNGQNGWRPSHRSTQWGHAGLCHTARHTAAQSQSQAIGFLNQKNRLGKICLGLFIWLVCFFLRFVTFVGLFLEGVGDLFLWMELIIPMICELLFVETLPLPCAPKLCEDGSRLFCEILLCYAWACRGSVWGNIYGQYLGTENKQLVKE